MQYWEDMRSKYGFNDGDATPNHADLYRDAYVLAVNTICEKIGSTTRVVPYNRFGMHNSVLILELPESVYRTLPVPYNPDAEIPPAVYDALETGADDLFGTAVEMAQNLPIDSYIVTRARFHKADLIKDLKKFNPTPEEIATGMWQARTDVSGDTTPV